jgi:hypothetical protein
MRRVNPTLVLRCLLLQSSRIKVDSTPAEGFDNALVDETLDLASLGLKSVTLLYRIS